MNKIAMMTGVLGLTATATAGLVGTAVQIGPEQHPEPGVVTVRVFLVFDDPLDQLLAISSDGDVSLLRFETDGEPLRQNCVGQAAARGEQCGCDCPGPGDLGGDTWVNIGEEMPDECEVSMEACDPEGCCIVGTSWGGGGYFDGSPGSPELPDEHGRILIAQFSLPDGTCLTYEGTASYNIGGGDLTAGAFQIEHCLCRGDLDASGAVDFDDLLRVLADWGPVASCPPHAPADLDKDCDVGFNDLLIVLNAWGPCA